MSECLQWLQEWYLSNCDNDWEHLYGVKIDTLDNPGWSLTIDLDETPLADKDFLDIQIERTDNDWVFCSIENKRFKAACGPLNLLEVVDIFRDWVTKEQNLTNSIT